MWVLVMICLGAKRVLGTFACVSTFLLVLRRAVRDQAHFRFFNVRFFPLPCSREKCREAEGVVLGGAPIEGPDQAMRGIHSRVISMVPS